MNEQPPRPPMPPGFPNRMPPPPPPPSNPDDVPELVDCIQDDGKHVEGAKVKTSTILNIPLVFHDWTFEKTKFKDAKSEEFVRIHFMYGGKLCYIETSSVVIMDQIRLFEQKSGGKRPFRADIRYENGSYFKFFRSK